MKFTESLALQRLSASIGSVGDAYDNALAETIIGLFKTEVVNRHGPFKTITEDEFALMEWADWYNNARLHSRLDYLTPGRIRSRVPLSTTATPTGAGLNPKPAPNP